MGRKRKGNRGLPERVYIDFGKPRKNGSRPKKIYYLKKLDGKRVFLGNTEPEALRNWVSLIERPKHIVITKDLIEDYLQEIASKKSKGTYEQEIIKSKFLKAFFGELKPNEITPQHIYEYMDIRSQKEKITNTVDGKSVTRIKGGMVAANKERSILSNIFNYAIRKGLVKDNPCRHVTPNKEYPRDRYPEDAELKAVYNESSQTLQCILDFAYLTGQRRGDILYIQQSQISGDGIFIMQSKTKAKLLIEWSAALTDCVNRARKLRGNLRSMYLFCKDNGQPYTIAGFKSMYKRAMQKALAKGVLKEKFNFHDIRAKTYSDDKDDAQKIKRAGHVDASMGRVYDRKVKKVKPLK